MFLQFMKSFSRPLQFRMMAESSDSRRKITFSFKNKNSDMKRACEDTNNMERKLPLDAF